MKKRSDNKTRLFHDTILVYLDSAYNYAHWLSRNPHDAEDLTQEACTRAYAAFDKFKPNNPKSWLLTIVRHTFLNQKQKEQRRGEVVYLDSISPLTTTPTALQDNHTPEKELLRQHDAKLVHTAINELNIEFREIIILRELEGLSYNEISAITDCALGTVMSRLSRARNQLKSKLTIAIKKTENKA